MGTNYTLNWSNDSLKAPFTLVYETLDTTTTSLSLTGKNYQNWGELMQENLIRMLEHFASDSEPANKTIGQIWFDTAVYRPKVYIGSTWKTLAFRRIDSETAPTGSSFPGDLWYDTVEDILKVYTVGGTWVSTCSQCDSVTPPPSDGDSTPPPSDGDSTPPPPPPPPSDGDSTPSDGDSTPPPPPPPSDSGDFATDEPAPPGSDDDGT